MMPSLSFRPNQSWLLNFFFIVISSSSVVFAKEDCFPGCRSLITVPCVALLYVLFANRQTGTQVERTKRLFAEKIRFDLFHQRLLRSHSLSIDHYSFSCPHRFIHGLQVFYIPSPHFTGHYAFFIFFYRLCNSIQLGRLLVDQREFHRPFRC